MLTQLDSFRICTSAGNGHPVVFRFGRAKTNLLAEDKNAIVQS